MLRKAAAILVAVLLVAVAVAMGLWWQRTGQPIPFPALGGCSIVRVPEAVPSAGYSWSKEHYPEQYSASNRRVVEMTGSDEVGVEPFPGHERFMDIAGWTYSRRFISGFSYTDPELRRPEVRLEYLRRAETFVGRITARRLKPNFAYQVKLQGVFWDRVSFERIGRLGRWRLPGWGLNFTDAQYEAYPDKSETQSYLMFDFFVTDSQGNAEKELYADSSLHVLWNPLWQRKPAMGDSVPVPVVREGSDPSLYANPNAGFGVQCVYAQCEGSASGGPARPPIGEAFLPPGRYRAELVLTEESFHGFGDAGRWASVLKAPVDFEIIDRPKPPRRWTLGQPVGELLSLRDAVKKNIDEMVCSETSFRGVASTNEPYVILSVNRDFPAGQRYYLAFEILSSDGHSCQIAIGRGWGFEAEGYYPVRARGCSGWRRMEVELTSRLAGRFINAVRIRPALRRGLVGVRNVQFYRIVQ